MARYVHLVSFVTAAFLAACASHAVTSSPLAKEKDQTSIEGVAYALPKAVVNLTVKVKPMPDAEEKKPPEEYVPQLEASVAYLPDETAWLVARMNRSAWSTDKYELTVGTNGLIATSNTTTQQQGDVVVSSVKSLIVESIKAGAAVVAGGGPGEFTAKRTDLSPEATAVLRRAASRDPMVYAVPQEKIETGGMIIDDVFERGSKWRLLVSALIENGKPTDKGPFVPDKTVEGIAFRMPKFLRFSVALQYDVEKDKEEDKEKDKKKATPIIEDGRIDVAFLVPDRSRMFWIDVPRHFAVDDQTNLTFTNGMLTRAYYDRPSTAAKLAGIPYEWAQALAAIPGQLLTIRTTAATQATALRTAENTVRNTQADADYEYETAMADAQNASALLDIANNASPKDPTRIAQAQMDLTKKRAAANRAAIKAGRPVPFPNN